MYTHVQTHPLPATYGDGSVCGKIYFANSVGRWTLLFYQKRQFQVIHDATSEFDLKHYVVTLIYDFL